MEARDRIIVPLDTSDEERALQWVRAVGRVGAFKIGYEFICAFFAGMLTVPQEHALKRLRRTQEIFSASGARFMLDLKLNDIQNTMAGALRAINALTPLFITVHASAGPRALERLAKEKGSAKLIAVTVLTSLESWE